MQGKLKEPLELSQNCEDSPLLLLAGILHWSHPEDETIGRVLFKQGWTFTILKEYVLPSLSLSQHHFHFLWCNEWVTWKSSWWSASDTMGSSLSSSSIESLHNLSWVKLNAICQSKVKTQTYKKQTNKKNISPKLLTNPVKSWIQRILNLWICPLDEIMMIIYTHQCER